MPPPQTQFTSLDIFTAAHSPRRFCQAKQKCIAAVLEFTFFYQRISLNIAVILIQNLYTPCTQRKMFIFFVCLLEEPLTFHKDLKTEKKSEISLSRGGGALPYMGHIGMCRCDGYGFQAVYSSIGYINQSVWV